MKDKISIKDNAYRFTRGIATFNQRLELFLLHVRILVKHNLHFSFDLPFPRHIAGKKNGSEFEELTVKNYLVSGKNWIRVSRETNQTNFSYVTKCCQVIDYKTSLRSKLK